MTPALKSGLGFAKAMFKGVLAHEARRMAAALAYYTVFALPASAPWEVIVEPDSDVQLVVVITAYPVEP